MADIQSFIQMASGSLSIGEEQARSATGGLMGFLQDKLPANDMQSLLGELPGAADLIPSGSSGGGLLGAASKLAGGALGGGKLGTLAGVASALTGSGLDAGKVGPFVTAFLGFAKSNLSGDLLGRILGAVPDLAKAAR